MAGYIKKTDIAYYKYRDTDNTYELSNTLRLLLEDSIDGYFKNEWGLKFYGKKNFYYYVTSRIVRLTGSLDYIEECLEQTEYCELPYRVFDKIKKHQRESKLTTADWYEKYWWVEGCRYSDARNLKLRSLDKFIRTTKTPVLELLFDEVEEFKIRL